jgi:hypothetical protein
MPLLKGDADGGKDGGQAQWEKGRNALESFRW